MKRLGWVVGAGAMFTAWGLLGWAHTSEPDRTETELAPAVTLHEDGSGTIDGAAFCLTGWVCDD
jgi:hypothetical protein